MSEILLWAAVFIGSLTVLIKASDYFTVAAEKIGVRFGMSPFIIGVTIVAFGTSMPEIITSVIAVLKDSSEIVIGNVVGSNIANIFLVFGLTTIVTKKKTLIHDRLRIDLSFLIGSALLLTATIWDGTFNMFEGLVCLAGIASYLFYATKTKEKHENPDLEKEIEEEAGREEAHWKAWAVLLASALGIYLGANYTIEAIIKLSELLNIGKEVIAVSAVAFGTSLPELVVSITAAKNGKLEIAAGNILGSNVFNALVVMGIAAMLGTLNIPHGIIDFGLPMMLLATALYTYMIFDKRIANWEGWVLLALYVFFIGRSFGFFHFGFF
jgi:cation:H+ antiporter